MSKQLPERPNLDHLRSQAKDLLTAFRSGDASAVERFKINLPSFAGPNSVALHDAQSVVAREYGHPSWAKLVEHVEEVRAREGITPEVSDRFVLAAVSESTGTVRRMLDLYPEIAKFNTVTALVCGEIAQNLNVGEGLGPKGWKPLEYVCFSRVHQVRPESYSGLESCAKALLDAGADANVSHPADGDETAPLPALFGATCESGHIGIARLLLDRGAQPNDGESIYHAAQGNRTDMLELLVAAGGDVSSKNPRWGNTPLCFLAGHRRTDPGAATALLGSAWLLEHGADPNVRSGEGEETPLHACCLSGNTPFLRLLLKHGADADAKRSDGRTPYAIARMTGNQEAADALRAAGASADLTEVDSFLAACASGDLSAAREGAHLRDWLGPVEKGLICKLAELGVADGVRVMLEVGFDIATPGECKGTPLHYACFCGWPGVALMLLERGAPIDVLDCCYQATPLGWALEGMVWNPNPEGDYVPIIQRLLQAGADPAEIRGYADSGETESQGLAEVLALIES